MLANARLDVVNWENGVGTGVHGMALWFHELNVNASSAIGSRLMTASPIVATTKGPPERTQNSENEPDDEKDDTDGPQHRNGKDEAQNHEDGARNDHG